MDTNLASSVTGATFEKTCANVTIEPTIESSAVLGDLHINNDDNNNVTIAAVSSTAPSDIPLFTVTEDSARSDKVDISSPMDDPTVHIATTGAENTKSETYGDEQESTLDKKKVNVKLSTGDNKSTDINTIHVVPIEQLRLRKGNNNVSKGAHREKTVNSTKPNQRNDKSSSTNPKVAAASTSSKKRRVPTNVHNIVDNKDRQRYINTFLLMAAISMVCLMLPIIGQFASHRFQINNLREGDSTIHETDFIDDVNAVPSVIYIDEELRYTDRMKRSLSFTKAIDSFEKLTNVGNIFNERCIPINLSIIDPKMQDSQERYHLLMELERARRYLVEHRELKNMCAKHIHNDLCFMIVSDVTMHNQGNDINGNKFHVLINPTKGGSGGETVSTLEKDVFCPKELPAKRFKRYVNFWISYFDPYTLSMHDRKMRKNDNSNPSGIIQHLLDVLQGKYTCH